MLDSETKRRIDSARDILVGKVPDPKSQVEQITIALVYKFMDDMDKQSIEMGGKASFFKGEFKKYSWTNIFDPRLGGVEMLNLYGEAITRMSQNENLPELFRNIFKNAFLPYRDPETLKLFLKTINEFTYDHSEKLGDAFEYLLSVLGSQGDAGQFRTPRHIIDFMVQVIGPKKNETVLDPACGTAGFLISAYKYMVQSAKESGKPLNAQDKKRIYENFKGYDISPDMVRLSLVNLYLHGFVTPKVHEYDTLTSEERWNDYADVILANPPFMSPKGGIQPHKRFSVQSNRSEVLFVDYMAEHLTPNGRAAIIVPEGIIFQSAGAYKQLRSYLIEHNYLWAVVSLPAGVFNPYAGVKTSILFLDKALARKTDQILFVKVEADGFDLGAQRRPIDRNDLPDALNTLRAWRDVVARGASPEAISLFHEGVASSGSTPSSQRHGASFHPTIDSALLVSTSRLAENEEYNLSADRYREVSRVGKQTYPLVGLGEICEIISGQSPEGKYYNEQGEGLPFYQGKTEFTEKYLGAPTTWTTNVTKIADKDDILMSVRAPVGPVNIATQKICIGRGLAAIRPDTSKALMEYVFINLKIKQDAIKGNSGSTFASINRSDIAKIQIPLPPLEIQRQIVDEIAAHQRIIDGARQVVEGWKPDIEIELAEHLTNREEKFPCSPLGEAVKIVAGFSFSSKDFSKKNPVKSIKITNVGVQEFVETEDANLPSEFRNKYSDYLAEAGDIAISLTRSIISSGLKFAFVPQSYANALLNQRVALIKQDNSSYDIKYIYFSLATDDVYQYVLNKSRSLMQPNLSINDLKAMQIPLPPLEVQHEIVARIERERSIVEGNRELIRIYEEKVKKVIERVWEG